MIVYLASQQPVFAMRHFLAIVRYATMANWNSVVAWFYVLLPV